MSPHPVLLGTHAPSGSGQCTPNSRVLDCLYLQRCASKGGPQQPYSTPGAQGAPGHVWEVDVKFPSSSPMHILCTLNRGDRAPSHLKSFWRTEVCKPEAGLPRLRDLQSNHLRAGSRAQQGIKASAAFPEMGGEVLGLVLTGAAGHQLVEPPPRGWCLPASLNHSKESTAGGLLQASLVTSLFKYLMLKPW